MKLQMHWQLYLRFTHPSEDHKEPLYIQIHDQHGYRNMVEEEFDF